MYAVLIVTVLFTAGCRSGTQQSTDAKSPVHSLCVFTSLPDVGPQAAVGNALLTGIAQALSGGVGVGSGDTLSLCRRLADTTRSGQAGASTVAANAAAATGQRTVALIGETTATNAAVAAAVLRQSGVPLIAASAPPDAAVLGPSTTTLYLLPAASSQALAEEQVQNADGCVKRLLPHTAQHCVLVTAPFCTGLSPTASTVTRYCVSPGPDLAAFPTPAQAYGYTAARLLVTALRAVSASGGNPGDRESDDRQLLALKPTLTPVGSVHFSHTGTISPGAFSLYTVQPGGGLSFDQELRAH